MTMCTQASNSIEHNQPSKLYTVIILNTSLYKILMWEQDIDNGS